jgi:hypothetical protein
VIVFHRARRFLFPFLTPTTPRQSMVNWRHAQLTVFAFCSSTGFLLRLRAILERILGSEPASPHTLGVRRHLGYRKRDCGVCQTNLSCENVRSSDEKPFSLLIL